MQKKFRDTQENNKYLAVLAPILIVTLILLTHLFIISTDSDQEDIKEPEPEAREIELLTTNYPEVIKKINEEKIDSHRAKKLCLELETKEDICLFKAAKKYESVEFCEYTSGEMLNDACYMYFVTQHDYKNCEKINRTNIKKSCSVLNKLNKNQEDEYA